MVDTNDDERNFNFKGVKNNPPMFCTMFCTLGISHESHWQRYYLLKFLDFVHLIHSVHTTSKLNNDYYANNYSGLRHITCRKGGQISLFFLVCK